MMEYKFVEVKFGFSGKPKEDYKEIIRKHAREGWRLVQMFVPSPSARYGGNYFDIIFEKPAE